MKILQSSVFRAICALATGILLIKYPDLTVTWITLAIGVLFLLSGIISIVVYIHETRHSTEYTITDASGRIVSGQKPTFPIVGLGSLILGLMLSLTPTVFITALMYIVGGILILGAVNQFLNLLNARHYGHISFAYWIFPSVVLLIGLYVIIKPLAPVNLAMTVLGWCTLLYGVAELINAIKIHSEKRRYTESAEVPVAEEVTDEASDKPVAGENSLTSRASSLP